MIGVFDSGMGGLFALSELRRLSDRIDIAFYADRKNAPYGTKSEEELLSLVSRDIEKLSSFGAEKTLMACCTASTVYDKLTEAQRSIAVPIIEPIANEAALKTKNGRVGILSTERTRRSGAFVKAISKKDARIRTFSVSAGELVALAESGKRDGNLEENDKKLIRKIISPILNCGVDTLILGCTHFAYFEEEIRNIFGVDTVNSASVAAEYMIKRIKNEGQGKTVILE